MEVFTISGPQLRKLLGSVLSAGLMSTQLAHSLCLCF